MSKAAVVAKKNAPISVGPKQVRDMARLACELRTQHRIEEAKRGLIQLLGKMGISEVEPFVLDDFETYAFAHQRVCVDVDGIILNYRAASRDKRPSIQLVAGRCTDCGEVPLIYRVESLADIAEILESPVYARDLLRFKCNNCKAAA